MDARIRLPTGSATRLHNLLPEDDDGAPTSISVPAVETTAWNRLRRVDRWIWDALLALVVVALSVIGFLIEQRGPGHRGADAIGLGLVLLATVPIAWRRRAPIVVVLVVGAAVSAFWFFDYEPALVLPLMIALYSAAAYRERERLVPVLGAVALVTAIAQNWAAEPIAREGFNWVEILAELVVTSGVPIALGRIVFNRRRRLARDRELAAREAVVAERNRIARELHDVVAHYMSVMVVQSQAARAVSESDPTAMREALRQVELSGRTGLAEMRRLLDVLKSENGEPGLSPQPGLAHLPELLAGMRSTGLSVEAIVEGEARSLPPGVDLSAYRIVQEALTNTLKHAGEASARVLLRYEPDALEVEIDDDGRGPAIGDGPTIGHGLIGMHERTQLFGGDFEAGARPGGGFRVRARLSTRSENAR
jgi:signal transduction histidine kinase